MTPAERLAQGLCPTCGAEAAPYRLCNGCRFRALIRRIVNRFHDQGGVTKTKEGRTHTYQHLPGISTPLEACVYREAQEGDRRLQPRLKHVPIDIEQTLGQLFTKWQLGPLTAEEILAAWGKLRVRPGRLSAAHDLAMLIRAERRRVARGMKR